MKSSELQRFFRIDESTAKTICQLVAGQADPCEVSPACDRWVRQCYSEPSRREQILEAINELLGGYGVEAVFDGDPCWPAMSYVNMGDTYRTTILWDDDNGYQISTMGDWVESQESSDDDGDDSDDCENDNSDEPDLSDALLIVDGAHGLYVPRVFATDYDPASWGISDADIEILRAGPDHDLYWDAWDDAIENATREYDGRKWRLYQDGDLWAIPVSGES